MSFNNEVKSFLLANHLVTKGDHLILAASGGVDSMALLFFFMQSRVELDIKLSAFHVNHNIRKGDADLDERLVADFCAEHEIDFYSEKLHGFDLSSSEADLRDARYQSFAKILKRFPNAKIAMGHHLDDQLETFLMRLAKGSRLRGLKVMEAQRGAFIRPFLRVTEAAIRSYARANQIPFREDHSNFDAEKMRNRIRARITPVLLDVFGDRFYDGFRKSLQDLNAIYHDYQQFSFEKFKDLLKRRDERVYVDLNGYTKLSYKQRQTLLEYCVSAYYPLNYSFSKNFFDAFNAFAENAKSGSRFDFENNIAVFKDRRQLCFCAIDETKTSGSVVELAENGEAVFGRNKISIKQVTQSRVKPDENRLNEYICGTRLSFPLYVRGWRQGDYFYPLGMKDKQKLSDFFVNNKIALNDKGNVPILLNRDQIVWVAGYRIDERYKLYPGCEKIYQIELKANRKV